MYKAIPKFEGFRRKDIISFVKLKLIIDYKWTNKAAIALLAKTIDYQIDGIGFSIWDRPFFQYWFNNHRLQIPPEIKKEAAKRVRKYAIQIINMSDHTKLEKALKEYYYKKKE